MTRMRLLQAWFAAATLAVVGALAFGGTVTVGTGTMLLMLSLVPAALVLIFWPGVEPRTAAHVPYDRIDQPSRRQLWIRTSGHVPKSTERLPRSC